MLVKIPEKTSDGVINLCLDTLEKKKQALVFVNAKRSAEKVAEDIGKKIKHSSPALKELSEKLLHALPRPTVQCERLARCVEQGVAFHHAGLHGTQKTLIEDNFRNGTISFIACTPTLAMGVDLPAFRCIIRDLKRYSQRGMGFIPVLEYLQIAGRAGRPKFENVGEAICVASSQFDKDELTVRYINGVPEDIYSKLAVEPVLRTYILSLIASRFVHTRKELMTFFSKTFWAFQFKDLEKLEHIIDRMLAMLEEWEFILPSKKADDFVSADELEKDVAFNATVLGKRVAELYLDPLTAHELVTALRKAIKAKTTNVIAFIHTLCTTLEMRPLLNVGTKDYAPVQAKLVEWQPELLVDEPSAFEAEYDDYLNAVKTTMMLNAWMEEDDEQALLDQFNVRPGELHVKKDNADWLLYGMKELANILGLNPIIKEINRARTRLKYGAKEELLPLLKLEGIGRIRARTMFKSGIKDLGDVRKASIEKLTDILGKAVALNVKKQTGEHN